MSETINKVLDKLKKYPKASFDSNSSSLTVNPKDDNGFPVSLIDHGDGNYTVAFDFWHEEFDNENDALNCFAFGLSKDCRLKIFKKSNRVIKWIVESNENGKWIEDSTTGLFSLSFWKKSKIEYLQNDLFNNT